jgi:hypothetical protein
MSIPLEEYYGVQPMTPTALELPALEKKKWAAVDKLNSLANRSYFMDSADPCVQDIRRTATLAVRNIELMEFTQFCPYDIYKYADESSSKLEARITAYESSKAECEQKSKEYSRISDQFDHMLYGANISSVPLNFSREAKQSVPGKIDPSTKFSSDYAPWDGSGINEKKLAFPSKESLVSCVKQNPLAVKTNLAVKTHNPYLKEDKLVDSVAESLAGKELVELDFKNRVILTVGELRASGALKNVPQGPENIGRLRSVHEAFAKCAISKQEPTQSSTPPQPQSGMGKEFMDDFIDALDDFY